MGLHDQEAADRDRAQQQLDDASRREIARVEDQNRRDRERQRELSSTTSSSSGHGERKKGGGFFRLIVLIALGWFAFKLFSG